MGGNTNATAAGSRRPRTSNDDVCSCVWGVYTYVGVVVCVCVCACAFACACACACVCVTMQPVATIQTFGEELNRSN